MRITPRRRWRRSTCLIAITTVVIIAKGVVAFVVVPTGRQRIRLYDTEAPPPIGLDGTLLVTNGLTKDSSTTGDVPKPTENGGFTHTKASRAKIAAANKGKVPWNKGKQRSEATKARIAAGVRRRNRERFLADLERRGITEAEHEAQIAEEKRRKELERLSRRTPKGGYRPTEETKRKISKVLKEKYASGELKPPTSSERPARRGFSHSEETKRRISESLKKRWATDEEYRAHMKEKSHQANQRVRQQISETLKQRWQDPEFRATMMAKMATSKGRSGVSLDEEHRAKISRSIKAKWQQEEYRQKTLASIAKRRASMPPKPRTKSKKDSRKKENEPTALPVHKDSVQKRSMKVKKATVAKLATAEVKRKKAPKKRKTKKKAAKEPAAKPKKTSKRNGNINLLREERRDLYDLLYGDEEEGSLGTLSSRNFEIGDENLDSFDPYGLDDF